MRIVLASVIAMLAFFSVSRMNTGRARRRINRTVTRGIRRMARIEIGDLLPTRQMARTGRRMIRQFAR
ncbi:hypothetical protein [Rubeoparvulum massiliense]|uniref:hypothetical protein n=1 Tax=Rubeoparvulum massiliense TaxID=1631346 RepID=UPI00065DBF6A|nr:hypothetical protein [Rubeoparvulum massiliense]